MQTSVVWIMVLVPVNNISVMSRLLPGEGERREEWNRTDPKQEAYFILLLAKYDTVISLKAAAESPPHCLPYTICYEWQEYSWFKQYLFR